MRGPRPVDPAAPAALGMGYGPTTEGRRRADQTLADRTMMQAADLGMTGVLEYGPGPDYKSLDIRFESGARFHYWPVSQWWNRIGGGNGRGLGPMLDDAKKTWLEDKQERDRAELVKRPEAPQWQPTVVMATEQTSWPAGRVFLNGLALGFGLGFAAASFLGAF